MKLVSNQESYWQWTGRPEEPMSQQGEIGQFHGGGLPCGGSGAGTNPDLHYTHGLEDSSSEIFTASVQEAI
jgi:hypothetical protein